MHIDTLLAQAGSHWDERTGAISAPLYQSSAFRHAGLGKSTGFDYSRSANPTRSILESAVATLEGDGVKGAAFGSGLAALDAVLRLFKPGDTLLVSEDPYGGSARLITDFYARWGLRAVYVNTADLHTVKRAFSEHSIQAVLLEVPTNPLLRVADIRAIADIAHAHGAKLLVDNTFLTPLRLRAFELGADIVLYSATKYLAGHNDVVAGIALSNDEETADRILWIQNAAGAILGPMDSWLILRGMKTLSVRLDRQEANAMAVAKFLSTHPAVSDVRYPGLQEDPGHELLKRQASGFGAMVSFEVKDANKVPHILENVRVFLFAESLGGTESLVTFPKVQTHADIPEDLRERLGINDRLLRLSLGLEHAQDLIDDLGRALA